MQGETEQSGNQQQQHPAAAPGSLLEGIDLPAAASPKPRAARGPRSFWPATVRRAGAGLSAWFKRNPGPGWTAAALIATSVGIGLYYALRPIPRPEYETADMDDILDYTLLSDDFNRLPVDERLRLLKQVIQRFSSMSSDDSVAMAAWAAAIKDELRDKIMRNASLIVMDLWDKSATDYRSVPDGEKDRWMDNTVVGLMKTMEDLTPGGARNISDEERLKEARAQAARDQKQMRSDDAPSSGDLGRMADFLRNGMGKFASPQQQTRAQQLMRDMTRHLRNQDISTGKPKK